MEYHRTFSTESAGACEEVRSVTCQPKRLSEAQRALSMERAAEQRD